MSRQRKQKLSFRDSGGKPGMAQSRDPFLFFKDGNSTPEASACPSPPDYKDFLDSIAQPSVESSTWADTPDWFLDHTSPLYPDELLDVNSFLGLDETALSMLGDDGPVPVENKETFQDLKFTSTPKSRTNSLQDSGIAETPSITQKTSRPEYKTVLHDITDSHKFNFQGANDSFISITDVAEEASTNTRDKPETLNLQGTCKGKRSIPIIRKKPRLFPTPSSSENKPSDTDKVGREQLIYYSGLNIYEKALGIVKYIHLPPSQVSKYQMLFLTFMKLRLDLEWKDLAYRFEINLPTVQSIFSTTLNVLSKSLIDLLPWHSKTVNSRTIAKNFYAFVIENACGKLVVVISNEKLPIVFVTPLYSMAQPASIILYLEGSKYFIPGDIICISNPLEYYQVSVEGDQLVFTQLSKVSQGSSFSQGVQNVLSKLDNYALCNASKLSEDVDISQVVTVCAALTNFNYMDLADPLTLKRIYQRSDHFLKSSLV